MWALLAVLTAAGCFGDDRGHGQPDADPTTTPRIDAAPGSLQIVSIEAPAEITTDETAAVVINLSGRPDEAIDFTLTAGGGRFAPATGTTALDGAGTGTINTDFTAPPDPGTYHHVAAVTDRHGGSAERGFDIVADAEERVGFSQYPPTFVDWNAGYLGAVPVYLPGDARLLRLGVIGEAGSRARLALYTDSGASHPYLLFANTAVFTMTDGRREVPVSPEPIPAGYYWVTVQFELTGRIGRDDATPITLNYSSSPFSSPLPSVFPTPYTYPLGAFPLYMVVDYD